MRFIALSLVVVVALLEVDLAPAIGQDIDVAFSERGPRFLLSGQPDPVRVDVARMPILRQRIALDLRNVGVYDALEIISRESGLRLMYSDNVVRDVRNVTLRAEAITVAAALTEVLIDAGVDVLFSSSGNAALIRGSRSERAAPNAQGTIVGRVTEAETGAAISSVDVLIEETEQRATTDAEGRYRLEDVASGSYTLTASRLGYAEASRSVNVVTGEEVKADFALEIAASEVEEIVVVGSRLGSSPTESAVRVEVLDREQIDRSGATTVAQALSLLPEVSVNNYGADPGQFTSAVGGPTNSTSVQLRGLPLGATLVLVNGRRVGGSSAMFANFGSGGFFDLSSIPLSMVERIEVLPYGASAVYGGDGLAGAVNIVTKRNASGLDVRVRNSIADGYHETQASVTWGKSWSHGSLMATASYGETGTLRDSERTLTRNVDFRRFGGSDRRRSRFGNPGTIYSLDGCPPEPATCTVPLEERGNLAGLDAPVAGIPTGQDGSRLTRADFAATAGLENLGSFDAQNFSGEETTSLRLQGRWELGSRLELFGDLLYSQRNVRAREVPLSISGGGSGTTRVSADNPFNPFGVDVGVAVVHQTTGIFNDVQFEYLQPTLGLRGNLGAWTWELAGSLARDRTESVRFRQDDAALSAALASPDPATALNPFRGDGGSVGSSKLIRSLFNRDQPNFGSDLWQVNGFARGPLAQLPAGAIEVVFGAEWEREELAFILEPDAEPDDPLSTTNVSGSDESRAAFAELRLPLLARSGANAGAHRQELLALTGALRVYDSDRVEETVTTETVGLELRPTASLLLRAATSSSFRPPRAFASFTGEDRRFADSPIFDVTDPKMGGETVFVALLFGRNQSLQSETGRSNTVGLVWTPSSLADLELSVTAWETRLRDRISFVNMQFLVDNEDLFPDRVIRDPETGMITAVDLSVLNIARSAVEGIDFSARWRWSTRYGTFRPSLAATWASKYEDQITPDSPVEDRLGVWNFFGWSPRWKGTTRLDWELPDQVRATLIGRYVGGYQDDAAFAAGPAAGTFQTLGEFWTFDLNVGLNVGRWLAAVDSWFADTRLSFGAANLFNRLPNFCNGCNGIGYDINQEDLIGRRTYAELRFSF